MSSLNHCSDYFNTMSTYGFITDKYIKPWYSCSIKHVKKLIDDDEDGYWAMVVISASLPYGSVAQLWRQHPYYIRMDHDHDLKESEIMKLNNIYRQTINKIIDNFLKKEVVNYNATSIWKDMIPPIMHGYLEVVHVKIKCNFRGLYPTPETTISTDGDDQDVLNILDHLIILFESDE